MLFTVQAILFDLDGVLVDTRDAVVGAWHAWANGLGIDLSGQPLHGRRGVDIIRAVAPKLDPQAAIIDVIALENARCEAGVDALPGAKGLLSMLPPNRWAIATSGWLRGAQSRLERAELVRPQVLVTADDVRFGKPNPEPYLTAAAGIGVSADACLVFEDSPAGIEAGRAAGCKTVALTTTHTPEQLVGADAIIATLADVCVHFGTSGIDVELTQSVSLSKTHS